VKHYGLYGSSKDRSSFRTAQKRMENLLGQALALSQGARVLDAGCGEGFVAAEIAHRFGYAVVGIDMLPESVAKARENARKYRWQNCEFYVGNYESLQFPDGSFDGVYTMETLMHATHPEAALLEFYRVLKPGGTAVHFEYALADRLPGAVDTDMRYMYEGGAMQNTYDLFRLGTITQAWEAAGFTEVSVHDLMSYTIPFMRRLYRIGIIPFRVLKVFGKERRFVNLFSAVRSYELRNYLYYVVVMARKSKQES
jgi:SAM-dependent methyltransferase